MNMGISSIRMIDMRRTMHISKLPSRDITELSTVLGKCGFSMNCSDDRYEDVGDMKRAMYHYERGVSQGDSASLYVI